MKNMPPNISPNTFTSSAILVAYLLMDDFTINEQDAIGEWFMLVGQILATNAAQRSVLEERNEQINQTKQNDDIDTIQDVLKKITKEIDQLKKYKK